MILPILFMSDQRLL